MYDTSRTIDLENAPLNGGILVKVLVHSIDLYLRRMMVGPDVQNFSESRTSMFVREIFNLISLCDSPCLNSDNRTLSGYCRGILLDKG